MKTLKSTLVMITTLANLSVAGVAQEPDKAPVKSSSQAPAAADPGHSAAHQPASPAPGGPAQAPFGAASGDLPAEACGRRPVGLHGAVRVGVDALWGRVTHTCRRMGPPRTCMSTTRMPDGAGWWPPGSGAGDPCPTSASGARGITAGSGSGWADWYGFGGPYRHYGWGGRAYWGGGRWNGVSRSYGGFRGGEGFHGGGFHGGGDSPED